MASPRWKKLRGDLRATWGRVLAMQLAITLALAAVGTVLGARAVLGREIVASYAATHPADATIVLAADVDDALLAAVRARPDVAEADRRQMIRARARARADEPWQMLVLYVVDDFTALRLARFEPDQGAWPPPTGAILVERSGVAVMGLAGGSHASHAGGHGAMLATLFAPRMTIQTPHGPPTQIAIAGTVHDAAQAPNWQEHRGCGYATRATLATLGEPAELHELLDELRGAPDREVAARDLAQWLRTTGHEVHEVRVPPHQQHPHQALMNGVQSVLLVFTLLLLVLSSIVVATILSTILARQTRDIGVMKAIGATTGQLAAMYGAFVLALGAIATLIALPLAHHLAHGMIGATAYMMNITVVDPALPFWVYAATALLGVGVPLAIAAVPILRAARLTVRAALASHGAAGSFVRPWLARLPIAIRNALRRPARLALVVSLLVTGGALVIAAANLDRSLRTISSHLADARHYDVEVRLHAPAPAAVLAELAALEGVRALEPWSAADAARGDLVRTYPDGGHGSFTLAAPPAAGSTLVTFPLRAGRWLAPGDTDAVVVGGTGRPGDQIAIDVDGVRSSWTVVGVVEEMAGSSAFVTPEAFARATRGGGATLLRFATTGATGPVLARIEGVLAAHAIPVRYAMPAPLLRTIIDDHVALVVRAVIVMAMVLALVGLFGLGAATAIQIAERTRELGILKTIGASDAQILGIVL
ncbi:MAG: ABC transporter permease, partial [Kofleriaceae bacterium]